MNVSSTSKCFKQSWKLSKSQETTMASVDIKSSLRDMGRKNYLEQDEDTMSDYGPSPRKKIKSSPTKKSERKLSLRGKQNTHPEVKSTLSNIESTTSIVADFVPPKRKYTKRYSEVIGQSDRKLRNQPVVEACCIQVDPNRASTSEPNNVENETKTTRKSKNMRLASSSSNPDATIQTELKATCSKQLQQSAISTSIGRTSMKDKLELSKPKVIDHISQSEEINIECTTLNIPKKSSSELKKSNTIVAQTETISARKSNTLSQKPTENNGGTCISHTTRNSISHHGKLCRKSKKTSIYHDSNGWVLSKGYWSADYEFWDLSHFGHRHDKSVKTQQEIEIPSFREKKYTPLYKIEGTEDLSDHVFEKRHLPYEIMEKKIKKNFVMQSKYELQKSKYLKNNELLYKKEPFFAKKFPKLIDLNPDPSDVKKIEIVMEVPVMSLGVPVKITDPVEFSLTPDVTE